MSTRNEIANMFSKRVVGSNAEHEYTFTQQISEYIKQNKYDGIIFSSSQGSGCNYAIFDNELIDISDRKIVEIESVDLNFNSLPEKSFEPKPKQ